MDPGDADREELADRVAELEQTVSKMLPDRRGVLKGLGAAAVGGAAVGASSGGASGQSGAAGAQGTPEEPNDMYAWDLDVQNGADFNGTDIEDAGAVSAVEELINMDPADLVDGGNTYPSAIRAANDGNSGGLLIQSRQSADAKGDPGYQANVDFVSGDGERLARISADRFEHQINWYVRPTPMDGSFGTPQSRMTLNGFGNDSTSADTTQLLVGNYDGGSTEIATTGVDSDAMFSWRTGSASEDRVFRIYWDASRDYMRFRDEENGIDAARYLNTEQRWDWQSKPMAGLREISNPTAGDLYDQEWAWDETDSRWLFKDSANAVHYFTPDGTL